MKFALWLESILGTLRTLRNASGSSYDYTGQNNSHQQSRNKTISCGIICKQYWRANNFYNQFDCDLLTKQKVNLLLRLQTCFFIHKMEDFTVWHRNYIIRIFGEKRYVILIILNDLVPPCEVSPPFLREGLNGLLPGSSPQTVEGSFERITAATVFGHM